MQKLIFDRISSFEIANKHNLKTHILGGDVSVYKLLKESRFPNPFHSANYNFGGLSHVWYCPFINLNTLKHDRDFLFHARTFSSCQTTSWSHGSLSNSFPQSIGFLLPTFHDSRLLWHVLCCFTLSITKMTAETDQQKIKHDPDQAVGNKYSILLPTYNEVENLPIIIWLIVKYMDQWWVVT